MTGDEYLRGILAKYAVNAAGAEAAGQQVYPIIENWAGKALLRAEFSGSLAKGTGNSIGTDADIFISLTSSVDSTLGYIFNSLHDALLANNYPARRQNVSIRTKANGYSIDLVPGRRQSQHGNDHSLYKSKSNSWTQTNVEVHIAYVKNSRRQEEIRVLKVWRHLHQLELPSFLLEMAVIDALHYARVGDLAANVMTVLEHLRDQIEYRRYVDPANSNNAVSDDCTAREKQAIASAARSSRLASTWDRIVW